MMSNSRHRREAAKKVAIGSAVAAAAGFVAGVLTAPKSGKETRSDIRHAADKGVAEAEKDLKAALAELEQAIKEAKVTSAKAGSKAQKEAKAALAKAKEAKDKTTEVLKAVKNGAADDKELDRAIKQSRHALSNLRQYLKK